MKIMPINLSNPRQSFKMRPNNVEATQLVSKASLKAQSENQLDAFNALLYEEILPKHAFDVEPTENDEEVKIRVFSLVDKSEKAKTYTIKKSQPGLDVQSRLDMSFDIMKALIDQISEGSSQRLSIKCKKCCC